MSLLLTLAGLASPLAMLLAGPATPPAATQPSAASPVTGDAFEPAVAAEAVKQLAERLESTFLYPDKGRAYAAMLRANLTSGRYAAFPGKAAFAAAVTADLQQIFADRHLRVHVVPPEARGGPGGEPQGPAPGRPEGIGKSGWLADGVAYIRFDLFPGDPATVEAVRRFTAAHAGARTLIVDLRQHRGGGLAEMDVLLPHLFTAERVLLAMDSRRMADGRDLLPDANRPSLREVPVSAEIVRRLHSVRPAAAPAFAETKVLLLTSSRTASAAEHFAFALKRAGRAEVIGERSYGAGNFGGMMPLDSGFTYAAFIPFGRTFDPETDQGWEGRGVEPDRAVPAAQALDAALGLAGVSGSGEKALAALK
jgi:hypothetical protein